MSAAGDDFGSARFHSMTTLCGRGRDRFGQVGDLPEQARRVPRPPWGDDMDKDDVDDQPGLIAADTTATTSSPSFSCTAQRRMSPGACSERPLLS